MSSGMLVISFFPRVQDKLHVHNRKKSRVLLSSCRHSKKCLWPLWNVLKVNRLHSTGGQLVFKVHTISNRSHMGDSQTYTQTASIYLVTTMKTAPFCHESHSCMYVTEVPVMLRLSRHSVCPAMYNRKLCFFFLLLLEGGLQVTRTAYYVHCSRQCVGVCTVCTVYVTVHTLPPPFPVLKTVMVNI